jgi:hypothetical protein
MSYASYLTQHHSQSDVLIPVWVPTLLNYCRFVLESSNADLDVRIREVLVLFEM